MSIDDLEGMGRREEVVLWDLLNERLKKKRVVIESDCVRGRAGNSDRVPTKTGNRDAISLFGRM